MLPRMGTGSPSSDLRLSSFLSRSGVQERATQARSGGDAKMRSGMSPRPKAVQRKALRGTAHGTLGSSRYPSVGHLSWVSPREIRSACFSRAAAAPPLPGPAPAAWASRESSELPRSDGENRNPAPPKRLRPETAGMKGGKEAEHGVPCWKGLSGQSGAGGRRRKCREEC